MATARFLVLPELLKTNERDGNVLDRDLLPSCIAIVKGDAVDLRQQVDSLSRTAQLDDGVGLKKVVHVQVQGAESKRLQCAQEAFDVFGVGLDPYVQILRVSRTPMKRYCVSPTTRWTL